MAAPSDRYNLIMYGLCEVEVFSDVVVAWRGDLVHHRRIPVRQTSINGVPASKSHYSGYPYCLTVPSILQTFPLLRSGTKSASWV